MILITAEDDPADTIRPRLDAHAANVSRVSHLAGVLDSSAVGEADSVFTLRDVDLLDDALSAQGDCRLVVIDPIGSYLGGRVDAHRDNEVRSVLAPVSLLAEKHNVAVLVVMHRRKAAGTTADDMAMGSRAFTGIARAVWHLSRDGENRDRRLLLPGKSNLAADTSGLAFDITGDPPALRWETDPVAMTADDALARENRSPDGETSLLDEAVAWLEDALADGPKPGKDLYSASAADGIKRRTLERAREKLNVATGPEGFGGPWVWSLPGSVGQSSSAPGQL